MIFVSTLFYFQINNTTCCKSNNKNDILTYKLTVCHKINFYLFFYKLLI
jgi:hypothetical protein